MTQIAEVRINLSGIADENDLHALFAQELKFFEGYGRNFDALWDCITDDTLSSMPCTLILMGHSALSLKLPEEARRLFDCLTDYSNMFPDRRIVYE